MKTCMLRRCRPLALERGVMEVVVEVTVVTVVTVVGVVRVQEVQR